MISVDHCVSLIIRSVTAQASTNAHRCLSLSFNAPHLINNQVQCVRQFDFRANSIIQNVHAAGIANRVI